MRGVRTQVRAETAAARGALRAVEARHEELARVEAALRGVRDLFQQLAALVALQQDQIDSVEYYALQTTHHVESGGQHLLKGTVTRTKARKVQTSFSVLHLHEVMITHFVVCTDDA